MLEKDINEKRKARHAETQEDFTPECIVEIMCDMFPAEVYTDFSKTVLDPCCGTGNLLVGVITRRLQNCRTQEDVYAAISTVYGTELMEDNTEEARNNILLKLLEVTSAKGINIDEGKLISILSHNIVTADTFSFDYENWRPAEKEPEAIQYTLY